METPFVALNSQEGHDNAFLDIREDEYEDDPPPSYHNIGPALTSFRDCIRQRAYGEPLALRSGAGHSSPADSRASRYLIRATQRRRSFGIGGAGNIRTTKESGVVVHTTAERLVLAAPNNFVTSVHPSALMTATPAFSAAVQSAREVNVFTGNENERHVSASGANDLRDKLMDGVKLIISNVGSAVHGSHGSHHVEQ